MKNYFPIYFRVQKLLVGGYGIDFTDPLFKALCIDFDEKTTQNDRLEDYLIHLNHLLRNSQQPLSIFKHLWKINTAWPSLQCYLWQPLATSSASTTTTPSTPARTSSSASAPRAGPPTSAAPLRSSRAGHRRVRLG